MQQLPSVALASLSPVFVLSELARVNPLSPSIYKSEINIYSFNNTPGPSTASQDRTAYKIKGRILLLCKIPTQFFREAFVQKLGNWQSVLVVQTTVY